MTTSYLIGAYAGLGTGTALILLSYLAPHISAGNFIPEFLEPSMVFGKKITRREMQLLGVLSYLLYSLAIGIGFVFLVRCGILSLNLLGALVVSFFVWLIVGLIVFPLRGYGAFGVRHDAWTPFDAFVAHLIWGFVFYGFLLVWIPRFVR